MLRSFYLCVPEFLSLSIMFFSVSQSLYCSGLRFLSFLSAAFASLRFNYFASPAAVSRVFAMQLRKVHSGSTLPYSRRFRVNSAATLVLPAVQFSQIGCCLPCFCLPIRL